MFFGEKTRKVLDAELLLWAFAKKPDLSENLFLDLGSSGRSVTIN